MFENSVREFQIIEEIGKGGFGAVFRAYDKNLNRDVAIKIILPEYANDEKFKKRFEIEAHLVAQLEHINIVPLYNYWQDESGAYLVMRYIRGGSLRKTINQHGTLSLSHTIRLLEQIADALDVAHHNDIIHRDIKPENILLDER